MGGLSLSNLYVALSRSSGQSTIRILCDFDENIFKTPQNPKLLVENDRLRLLNEKMLKEWTDAGGESRMSRITGGEGSAS